MPPLNTYQRGILVATTVLLAGLAIVVPWEYRMDIQGVKRSEHYGYSLIISPPVKTFYSRDTQSVLLDDRFRACVDWPRVLVPMLVVIIAAGVGFVLAGQYAHPAAPSSTAIRSGEPPHRA